MSGIVESIEFLCKNEDFGTMKESMGHNDHSINKQEVEEVVKRAFGSTIKLIDYNIGPYSKQISGYLGEHQSLKVITSYADTMEVKRHRFFVKSIPNDIEERISLIEENKFFFKETNFYKCIAPELIRSSQDRSWIAECYLVNDRALVFEDLKLKNFTMKDKVLDFVHVKSALAAFAKMHGASLLAEKRLGKTFLEIHSEILMESVFTTKDKSSRWMNSGIEVVESIAKSLGYDSSVIGNISKVINAVIEAIQPSKKWPNVISHGDGWSNNLMFDDTQPLPRSVLFDFQAVRYAPVTTDLLQFMYLCTRRQFREENEENLLRFYNDVLHSILMESNQDVTILTQEEIVQQYEELRIIGIVTACLYFPISLANGIEMNEKMKENYADVCFNKRDHLVMSNMEKDPVYKERLEEIVVELMERLEQLFSVIKNLQ